MTRVFECTEERIQELGKALGGSLFVSEDQRRERALADGIPYQSRSQSTGLFTEDQLKTQGLVPTPSLHSDSHLDTQHVR